MNNIENSGKYWDISCNPIIVKGGGWHCTKIKPGCKNCWAEKYNFRFGNRKPYDGRKVIYDINWNIVEKLWTKRKPRRVFVCDLCDFWHRDIPESFRLTLLGIMQSLPQHQFIILTKRYNCLPVESAENIIIGASVSTPQESVDFKILQAKFPAVSILSLEPLLSYVHPYWKGIKQVIIGCERLGGRKAGGFQDGFWDAAKEVIESCDERGISVWFKQGPVKGKVSESFEDFPPWARRRKWFGK